MAATLQPLYFPELPPELRPIMEAFYPRFSAAEMQRRRAMLQELMAAAGVEHLLLYGANRAGNAIPYFTHWPTTTEAACIVIGGRARQDVHPVLQPRRACPRDCQ